MQYKADHDQPGHHLGLMLHQVLEYPKVRCKDAKGALDHPSSPAVFEDPLLDVQTVSGIGLH